MTTGYEDDFYGWTQEQAAALRRAAALEPNLPLAVDWANLADEVEDMGRSQLRELRSRYAVLLTHLLKWQYQPDQRSHSWAGTIRRKRREIERHLADNPSLKPQRERLFQEAYDDARDQTSIETNLPVETFPPASPFSIEEAFDLPVDLS